MSDVKKEYTLQKLSKLLQECALGARDTQQAAGELSHLKFEGGLAVVNSAIHFLHHFYADSDVSSNDKDYDHHMKEKLLNYANKVCSLVE